MKIGFTCGAFDVCHAGHVLMLKECKTVCDHLIVGLQSDPTLDRPEKNKPIQSIEERKTMLESIRYVDEVIVYDTEEDLYTLLKENPYNIDIRIIGADWKDKEYTGRDLPLEVHFNARDHEYSTSELRDRIIQQELLK